jgi:N-acetyl-anhydromuramyl-L-alanine amidase AmpD
MKRQRTDFIYLSAAPEASLKSLDLRDRKRGFFECVYHFVIGRSGDIEKGRDYENHAMGLGWRTNALAVSICLVGGLAVDPPFTVQQDEKLKELVMELKQEYPEATLRFHASYPQELRPKEDSHDDCSG